MFKKETLQEFYVRNPKANPLGLSMNNAHGWGHFNVFERNNCFRVTPYNRRDFYKISLIIGTGKLNYADRWMQIDRPALLFSNPFVPYSWEAESEKQEGYFCLFSEAFVGKEQKEVLQQTPLFKIGGSPLFFLNETQQDTIDGIFRKMRMEIGSDYTFKYELLRNYLYLIIHEALKMEPVSDYRQHVNASSRIAELFLELLERQFPVDSHERTLQLNKATDYAAGLSVHVNHLNRAVKEVTGKTTTEWIAERTIREAKALLLHSDWNIAQIAYSLGFNSPAYFNTFFRKWTGTTPLSLRREHV